MNLRDQAIAVLRQHGASYHFMNVDEAADAILALVRAHLTSEEAVKRMLDAYVNEPPRGNVHNLFHAAILAALGDTHD